MATETHRQFYIVFSSRALDSIESLIESYYDKIRDGSSRVELKEFSLLVPDKFKNQQTTRTFVVIDERVFDLLKKSENEIDEFKIEKLQMKKHFYPHEERFELPSLYISLPKNLSLSVVQDHMIERMSTLRSYGIWNKSDYTIYIPKIDRAGNNHSGIAFIYFNGFEEIRLDDIVLSRLFINNTKWPGTNQEVHCFWKRTKEALNHNKDDTESEYTLEGEKTKSEEEQEDNTWVTKVKKSIKKNGEVKK